MKVAELCHPACVAGRTAWVVGAALAFFRHSGDGMRNCELGIAPQRTVMLMAEDKPGAGRTLIGRYYFYEK